jgi:predicted nucleotidyltransferase
MVDKINDILNDLEKEHIVKIIFSVESGSRVWGMESKDSDYDIRGVYIDLDPIKRNKTFLYQKTQCIDGFTEDRIYDWVFWDIGTFLKFVKNNNPTAIDWIMSTTCYRGKKEQEKIRDYFMSYCNLNYYLFHHYGLLKSMYEKYVNPYRKTKKYIDKNATLNKIDRIKHNLDLMKVSNTEKVSSFIMRSMIDLSEIKSVIEKEYLEKVEHTDTKIKKILYVCRSALSIEYILQQNKYPSLNINNILNDPNLVLDFDKTLIANIIVKKCNSNESDDCVCPSWLITWYEKLNNTIMVNCIKRDNRKIKVDDDIYIKYYMECVEGIT